VLNTHIGILHIRVVKLFVLFNYFTQWDKLVLFKYYIKNKIEYEDL
jgi:hypothetical protein